LAYALEQPETRAEATEALQGLVDAITLTPTDGEPPSRADKDPRFGGPRLRIELKGNLAARLGATVQSKRAPETEALSLQVSLVAGACNQRYLQLWSGAA